MNKGKLQVKSVIAAILLGTMATFGNFASAQDETIDLKNLGVGPIKKVDVGPIDEKLVAQGKATFDSKCSVCHKIGERYVGPDLAGVTKRRSPEWIMNMILNPAEMTKQDPIAQELLGNFLTQMTFQNVSEAESRAILEYFRSKDGK